MPTIVVGIATGADDGYSTSASAFNNNNNYVHFGDNAGVGLDTFLRFQNVAIPNSAVITAASIQFQANSSLAGTTVNVNIKGDASDNATAPTTRATHTGKTRTSASVNWQPGGQTAGSNYTTPDISSVIQEIVNRAGWVSGNALQILIDNNGSSANARREEKAYDLSTTLCAQLSITYVVGSNFFMFF